MAPVLTRLIRKAVQLSVAIIGSEYPIVAIQQDCGCGKAIEDADGIRMFGGHTALNGSLGAPIMPFSTVNSSKNPWIPPSRRHSGWHENCWLQTECHGINKPVIRASPDVVPTRRLKSPGRGFFSCLAKQRRANMTEDSAGKPLTFLEVAGSVLAAFLGVQSRENKIRDFTRGNAIHFILTGVLLTAAFVGVIVAVVASVTGGL
ncbi:MAG: DUF2970 domain-containing protein [Pseudomonadales bacterium]